MKNVGNINEKRTRLKPVLVTIFVLGVISFSRHVSEVRSFRVEKRMEVRDSSRRDPIGTINFKDFYATFSHVAETPDETNRFTLYLAEYHRKLNVKIKNCINERLVFIK